MDGKCYLCRLHYYIDGLCPGCGAYEPGSRQWPAQEIKVTDGSASNGESYGYHKMKIKKGVLGEADKIREEFEEFVDAHDQKNAVMELVELSDLLGAIEAYTKRRYNVDLDTLMIMTRATQRAFRNGHRS